MPFPTLTLNPRWPASYTLVQAQEQYPDRAENLQSVLLLLPAAPDSAPTFYEPPFLEDIGAAAAPGAPVAPDLVRQGLWYLAHPVRMTGGNENFARSTALAAQLVARGILVYAPATYTIAIRDVLQSAEARPETPGLLALPTQPDEYWFALDYVFAQACQGLVLAPGWERSRGCHREIGWFEAFRRPVLELRVGGE